MIRRSATRRAFTLVELMAVVVILAVLAGVAIPRFFDYSADAKEAACKGALGGMRAGIANFYADKAINSAVADYPSLAELTASGTVMQGALPENPYNSSNAVRDADGTWVAGAPPVSGAQGWAYDETNGKFWANSSGSSENLF